jgi:methylaspartate mutase epsilon subunit
LVPATPSYDLDKEEWMGPKIRNKRIDEDQFLKMRDPVLALWPTGKEVDLEEAVEYQKNLPESKSFLKVIQKLHREGRTVVFPRAGTPILEEEIKLCRTLIESGVPLIPVTTDSYTRSLQLQKVQESLEESIRVGRPMLNGYPLINHGVKNTRKLVESCEGAFNPRTSRLSQGLGLEIAFASGMTAAATSPFALFGCYEKNATLEETLASSQYVYRLMGYYAEREPILTTDLHGWLSCGVYPWSVNIATIVVESLMAAEQGVKSIIPLVQCLGNMAQDLAWIRVTPRLVRDYLDKFGYQETLLPGTFACQMPLFPVPQDMGESFGYLNYTAMLAALAQVEAVSVRTIDEGAGVATPESHALSYRSANWVLNIMRPQKIQIEIKEAEIEERITEMEVRAIVNKVLEMGDGDVLIGSIKAVEAGVLDSPFCPNVNVRDKVLGVKDCRGACRYAEFGNLPLPEEAKEFHRERLAEREKAEGRKMNYNVAVEDLWAFSQGKLIGSPSSTSQIQSVKPTVAAKRKPTVITGTVGMDAHVIGTKVLSRALRDAGFKVIELGCLTQPEEFIRVAIETNADVMLMTSLYGMAELDLRGFKEKCIESGLGDVLLYIGGILGVGRHDFKDDEIKFKKMGFDRVYPPEADLKSAIADLWADLKTKGKA